MGKETWLFIKRNVFSQLLSFLECISNIWVRIICLIKSWFPGRFWQSSSPKVFKQAFRIRIMAIGCSNSWFRKAESHKWSVFTVKGDYLLSSAAHWAAICIIQCVNDKKIEVKRLLITYRDELILNNFRRTKDCVVGGQNYVYTNIKWHFQIILLT